MGLFDAWRKKGDISAKTEAEGTETENRKSFGFQNPVDFVAEIKNVQSYKEHGSMLLCEVFSGEINAGDSLFYTDTNGRAIFNCKIKNIFLSGVPVKKAQACIFGLAGPLFGFEIEEFAQNAFCEGNYLYQAAAEGSELSEVDKVYQECTISREHREELGTLLEGEGITAEQLSELSIQETIYLLCLNRTYIVNAGVQKGEQHPLVSQEERIYSSFIEKLKKAETLWITVDERTGFPFYNNGFADVYTKEEYAKLAVMYYGKSFRRLQVRAIKPMPSLKDTEPALFLLLYYLGLEKIMVDNGLSRAMVMRSELLAPPDYSNNPPAQRPAENPELRLRMLDFFGEIYWQVNYENRPKVLKAKEDAMLKQLAKSVLIVPIQYEGMELKNGANALAIEPETKIVFGSLKNSENDTFLPLFTDLMEFGKMYRDTKWAGMSIPFKEALRFTGGNGVVVNPTGENLALPANALENVKKWMDEQTEETGAEAENSKTEEN